MRKIILPALFLLGILALILILTSFFPKYLGGLIFLAIFLIGDLALWLSVRKWIKHRAAPLKLLLAALYWLPAVSLFGLVIFGFIVPFIFWNVTVKAILMSLLMMTIVAKMIPLAVSLISRLAGLIISRLFKVKATWLRWVDLSAWIIGGMFWILLLLGMITWVYDFKVTTVDFSSRKIPGSFSNFRIVQFSDVHLGNWTCREKLAEVVDRINALKPDLIVFTGDMFTFSTAEGRDFIPYFKKLHAPSGVFAIMGNHDYGDYVKWESSLAKHQNLRISGRFTPNWDGNCCLINRL